jgi:hypothetical protein
MPGLVEFLTSFFFVGIVLVFLVYTPQKNLENTGLGEKENGKREFHHLDDASMKLTFSVRNATRSREERGIKPKTIILRNLEFLGNLPFHVYTYILANKTGAYYEGKEDQNLSELDVVDFTDYGAEQTSYDAEGRMVISRRHGGKLRFPMPNACLIDKNCRQDVLSLMSETIANGIGKMEPIKHI